MIYSEHELRNPPEELVRRRLLLPLSRFRDDDIGSMDYQRWSTADHRFSSYYEEREKIKALTADIERNGLRHKIEIRCSGPGNAAVSDGHHRIYVLRRVLECTHVPYRWYNPDRKVGPQDWWAGRTRYERGRLPAKESAA